MNLVALTHHSPPALLTALDDLLGEVFGLSLAAWRTQGAWTSDYTAYALEENGVILTNASLCQVSLRSRGGVQTAYQVGAVATRPSWRGRGLARVLMQSILDRHGEQPLFLFANDSVLDFYPRFGFRRAEDYTPRLRRSLGAARSGMVPLAEDDPAVANILRDRAVFSSLLDCPSAFSIHWFHYLYEYPGCIYQVPALGVMLAARQEGSVLTLMDVAARQPLSFDQLAPYLGFAGVEEIRFGFNPDWLGIDYDLLGPPPDSTLFVRGNLSLPPGAIIPWAART